MTPYETLGVDTDAPLDEIEASYRLLLRRFSPQTVEDLDPATKSEAAIRTRELHAAMAQVRKDQRGGGPRTWGFAEDDATNPPPPASPFLSDAPGEPAAAGGDTEWRYDDLHALVPCPYCDRGFLDIDEFRTHLSDAHEDDVRRRKSDGEPSVLDLLGVGRIIIAGVLLVGAIAALVLSAPVWITVVALAAIFVVLLTAALPKRTSSGFGRKRVRQHKAIRWF